MKQKLEELTLKIETVETLIDKVSDVPYDKAVKVVTDTIQKETHKEESCLIEKRKSGGLPPQLKPPLFPMAIAHRSRRGMQRN